MNAAEWVQANQIWLTLTAVAISLASLTITLLRQRAEWILEFGRLTAETLARAEHCKTLADKTILQIDGTFAVSGFVNSTPRQHAHDEVKKLACKANDIFDLATANVERTDNLLVPIVPLSRRLREAYKALHEVRRCEIELEDRLNEFRNERSSALDRQQPPSSMSDPKVS